MSKEELRYSVEYSKSNRSSCKGCKKTISEGAIRVGHETKSRVFDGYDVKYYHLKCAKLNGVYFLNQLKSFELLRWDDQIQIRELLGDKSEIKNAMEKQNYYNDVWKIKDQLMDHLKPAQIKAMVTLNYNLDLQPASAVHTVADGMCYGRIGPCPNCNCLSVLFDGSGFYCKGWVSSFSRCDWHGEEVKRYKFLLPTEGPVSKIKIISDYVFPHHHPFENLPSDYVAPSHINGNGDNNNPSTSSVIIDEDGNVSNAIPTTTTAATETVFKYRGEKPTNLESALLKVNPEFSRATKKASEIVIEHSDQYGYTPYNISLNMTDLKTNNNSYYILQLIKCGVTYYCFCKWGRIGVSSGSGGGATDHSFSSLSSALEEFKDKFKDKTGCDWDQRSTYRKIPGKYFVVQLEDDSQDSVDPELLKNLERLDTKDSVLPQRVQELIKTIFNEKLMRQQLEALSFDIQKMPLGKISQTQVKNAYKVLTEIQDLLETEKPSRSMLSDASNRFYTLIPHNFGHQIVPIIDNKPLLLQKMKLVDVMSEIEVINNLKMRLAKSQSSGNNIDDQYAQLKAEITPLDKDSYDYRTLSDISLSTFDSENVNFTAEILDIFKVNREGESERYQEKWEYNQNKMNLFHGSRTNNFVGILEKGLKKAPKESPKSGYMFGKGVYHADCMSVSLGYCYSSKENPIAILAISEVALGSSEAVTRETYMEEATTGFNSTKAIGSRSPSTFDSFNDITMLRGPIITNPVQSCVTHSEYVVYDETQINIKYLLMVKVNHS